jgi:hypothetical protein
VGDNSEGETTVGMTHYMTWFTNAWELDYKSDVDETTRALTNYGIVGPIIVAYASNAFQVSFCNKDVPFRGEFFRRFVLPLQLPYSYRYSYRCSYRYSYAPCVDTSASLTAVSLEAPRPRRGPVAGPKRENQGVQNRGIFLQIRHRKNP